MTRGFSLAPGRYLRANNSLAPSLGSLGFFSGGNGFASTVPLSCASAGEALTMTESRRAIRNRRGCMPAKTSMELAGPDQRAVRNAATIPAQIRETAAALKINLGRGRVSPLQAAYGTRNISPKYCRA